MAKGTPGGMCREDFLKCAKKVRAKQDDPKRSGEPGVKKRRRSGCTVQLKGAVAREKSALTTDCEGTVNLVDMNDPSSEAEDAEDQVDDEVIQVAVDPNVGFQTVASRMSRRRVQASAKELEEIR